MRRRGGTEQVRVHLRVLPTDSCQEVPGALFGLLSGLLLGGAVATSRFLSWCLGACVYIIFCVDRR